MRNMENCKLFLAVVFIFYDWSKFSNTETRPSEGEEFYKCILFRRLPFCRFPIHSLCEIVTLEQLITEPRRVKK